MGAVWACVWAHGKVTATRLALQRWWAIHVPAASLWPSPIFGSRAASSATDRRLPSRGPQRGLDRALPPGPPRSARPFFPV